MSDERSESTRLIEAMNQRMANTTAEVTPWFVAHMPPSYFRDLDASTVEDHLSAIIAARSSGQPIALTLKSADDDQWTFINAEDKPGLLAHLVDQLPSDRPLDSARIYTAADGRLVIDLFSFRKARPFDPCVPEHKAAFERLVSAIPDHAPQLTETMVAQHCHGCRAAYVLAVSRKRFFKHLDLFNAVAGTEKVTTYVEPVTSAPGLSRFIVAAANADPTSLFRRTARYLSTRGIDVRRAYLEAMGPAGGPTVSMISLVVVDPEGHALNSEHPLWTEVRSDLARLPWLDRRVLSRANEYVSHPEMSLTRCELLVALADLVHQRIGPPEPYRFSRDRIEDLTFKNLDNALALIGIVVDRFTTGSTNDSAYAQQIRRIREQAPGAQGDASGRHVLEMLCEAALAIQGTNLHETGRCALGLDIDPAFLHGEAADERSHPYGVLYFFGRMFHGFHVRFRNIARGGLRVVRPRGRVAYSSETIRLYSEAWGLANAQQLKNKDIPEGGAKGVILAAPQASTDRVVKALGDTLLDINLRSDSGPENLIYLGPDENITDDLITWLVHQAAKRGHPSPHTFMSSKPGAGINHKEYGVTSEGVVVFLEAALKARGCDPRTTPFTVKMTGGPDGDVAGNAIRIMHREFGAHTRIVAIADGTGSAEDPAGLDLKELLRLVEGGHGIVAFDRAYLGPEGRCLTLDEPGGLEARNTLHNRVVADAFVPCGGRPAAVNGNTWQHFMVDANTASAGVVVEGANLFFTEEARNALARAAEVMFVKDSSANKCGVICSSFEIAASLLIDEATFLHIKDHFVTEVLDRLRTLARKEAAILFSQYQRRPSIPLSTVSVRLSDTINRMKDAVIDRLGHLEAQDAARADALVNMHLPQSLREAAGPKAIGALPRPYFNRIIASVLASEIIYREGIDYLEDVNPQRMGDLAVEYLRHLEEIKRLRQVIQGLDIPEAQNIMDRLR